MLKQKDSFFAFSLSCRLHSICAIAGTECTLTFTGFASGLHKRCHRHLVCDTLGLCVHLVCACITLGLKAQVQIEKRIAYTCAAVVMTVPGQV